MGDQNQLLKDFAAPNSQGTQSSITRPNVEANNFELKPSLLLMVQHNRRRLFPFSLRDKDRAWLHSLPTGSITTWDQLSRAFLAKYFPPSKTAQMRNQITSFVQKEGESLYEAWERYKELLSMCPHHGLEKWLIVHTFYNGLTYNTRMTVDAAAGGALMNKTIDEAYTLIEDMAQNHYQWANERAPHTSIGGKYEIDALDHISSKVDALFKKVKYEIDALDHISSKVDALFKKVEGLSINSVADHISSKVDALFKKVEGLSINSVASTSISCEICGYVGQSALQCQLGNPPSIDTSGNEQVNYVNNFNQKGDPFSNTYNPRWRNHPNLSYRNPPENPMPASNFGPPGFRPPQSNFPSQKSNLENMMEKFVMTQSKLNEEFKQQLQTTNEVVKQLASKMDSLATHNKMLETQITQLAQNVSSSSRPSGMLPGQPETNPRGHVNAINLMSGKQYEGPKMKENDGVDGHHEEKNKNVIDVNNETQMQEEEKVEKYVAPAPYKPPLPFPQMLAKAKLEKQFGKFLEILKKLHINS
ncbi:uncharacterized protein LOC109833032 [Asparagus officinalis]|uniref:uncharacterized protein LOC109833032 n=1 Tax=Asparagus officinalis TaxID=4686 RepID=UPI00098E2637|nr:uncharacterized protein LOC109833032 [Asparagus officinalis]